jgi:tetratricopeptide (TPR) repeat protein/pimeloyl-ACP methyl ester carboxylesterase
MSELFKIATPLGEPCASVVLVHGLGGHHYDTWRRGAESEAWSTDPTFWPLWLRRDLKDVALYSIGYDAPVSRLRGTAMHFTDQARNILAIVVAEPILAKGPLIFIGHSLGGLLIKQMLRTAESMASYQADAANLLQRVEKIAFLGTPHSGSELASLGDRLRIIIRPSAATAALVRNDPNLRDLNNWYRDWANARSLSHLILTETSPTRVLGMIVPPDSADPGLSRVRSVAVAADHITICKPSTATQDIYVLLRDFVTRQLDKPKSLSDEVVDKLIAVLDERGEIAKAASNGLERQIIVKLAKRIRPDEELDFDQAVAALENAVAIALESIARGERGTNQDQFVNTVLERVAEQTKAGEFDRAAKEVDAALVELDRRQAEQRESLQRSRIALLEAGIEQDILRRDAVAVALRVARIAATKEPTDTAQRFEVLRQHQDSFHIEGRDKGLNFSLEIAIEIAQQTLRSALDADQRGAALNDLAVSLRTLGDRETGTKRLEEAVTAVRNALLEYTRERAPLDWAGTQNNLGNALRDLGDRETGTARLEEAVTAFRNALLEYTRERAPFDWAMTENNLGNALQILGERGAGTARLEEAATAYRNALLEYTRERVPLAWATIQNNLGTALQSLGERETGTVRLKEAVTALRNALLERARERVPLDWAMTQNNLGNALRSLGERETGTAQLEEAVAACSAALQVFEGSQATFYLEMTQRNLAYAQTQLAARQFPKSAQ